LLWAKAVVAFEPFGWLLAFAKAKAGSKAQPNRAKLWCQSSILSIPESLSYVPIGKIVLGSQWWQQK
jgi:hypothetical protein